MNLGYIPGIFLFFSIPLFFLSAQYIPEVHSKSLGSEFYFEDRKKSAELMKEDEPDYEYTAREMLAIVKNKDHYISSIIISYNLLEAFYIDFIQKKGLYI